MVSLYDRFVDEGETHRLFIMKKISHSEAVKKMKTIWSRVHQAY